MADWHFGYQFLTDVVGESNYKSALQECYTDPNSYRKGNSAFVDATLVFEPDNPYDANAVAVFTSHGQIGYLSRENAKKYRELCDGETSDKTVKCKIFSKDGKLFGAYVDLILDDVDVRPDQRVSPVNQNTDDDTARFWTVPRTLLLIFVGVIAIVFFFG